MSSKRSAPPTPGSSEKKRKVLSLAEKMDVLAVIDSGLGWSATGKKFGLHEATVRTIWKTREKIRQSVRESADVSSKVASVSRRDPLLEKMEKILNRWISEQVDQRKSNVDGVAIREKARSIYDHLAEKEPSGSSPAPGFIASHGWFHRFKQRFSLHNIARTGESGSADKEGAQAYLSTFKSLIEDSDYLPEQVFNADETGLFYKKMGNRTYIHKEVKKLPGFKAFKDRLTLLFVGNAAGDCKIKPLLVYRAANPRALKGLNKRFLSVVWKSNKKAWVTAKVFEEWFHEHFVPEVQLYMSKKNLAFKAVLLVDNAGGHTSQALNLDHPNVCVSYLPPRTTSLLQPMDMGVIKTFKCNYQRAVYREALKRMEDDSTMTLMDFWKQYNIRHALLTIKQAWDEVKPSTLNACWYALWPECVNDFNGFPAVTQQMKDIVDLAHTVGGEGFSDMTEEDVAELIDSHGAEPSVEEIIQMNEDDQAGDDADEDDDTETRPVFTIMKLRNLLREADNLTELFTDQDPIQERSIKFKRVVDEGLIPYKETLRSMEASACQKPITAFFKPSPASTPAKKHSTPATPPVTTPARQPVTPATPDNTTSSMSSVSPIPLCGFDDPDDTDSE